MPFYPETKVCKQCKTNKPASEYYAHNTNRDRLFSICKKCCNDNRRERYLDKKDADFGHLDRVQQFVQGYLDPSLLSDDEVAGSYILDDNGKPVGSAEIRQKYLPKFQKELSRRLNDFLRKNSPRALETILDIMSSDLVEPADRFRAAQWWIERIVGKTPETLLIGAAEKPYETIFEQLETSSRDSYRNGTVAIESADGKVIDAEIVEADDSSTNGNDSVGDTRRLGVSHEHGVSAGIPVDDPKARADEIIQKEKDTKELKDRIRKAQKRRYAARAQGVGLNGDPAWLIRYQKRTGTRERGFLCVLVAPERQTQRELGMVG